MLMANDKKGRMKKVRQRGGSGSDAGKTAVLTGSASGEVIMRAGH